MPKSTHIARLGFTEEALADFVNSWRAPDADAGVAKLLLEFPTVYIVQQRVSEKYNVYVGETTDIQSRSTQHLKTDVASREDWKALVESRDSEMFVIGNQYFNKSLTLDIENRLMLYLTGVESVKELHNRRSNPQRSYYTQERFDEVFSEIWRTLGQRNKRLFPPESIIRDSALFKASPFHKLTDEQMEAKRVVTAAITGALQDPDLSLPGEGKLLVVEGAAGTGKTVLMSSIFYDLVQGNTRDDEPFEFQDLDAYILVNHDQQLVVYEQIARKLGLSKNGVPRVDKPTRFINTRPAGHKADVVLVDEAHLLWTQGKQSYRGKNQLMDLLTRAKVVVAVYDPKQTVATNQYWEPVFAEFLATQETIELHQQMRIDSSPETWAWLRDFIDRGLVGDIPNDPRYDLRIFEDPATMFGEIRRKSSDQEHGLSRMLATFDWQFAKGRAAPGGGKWLVEVDKLRIPWNLQIDYTPRERRQVSKLSWAEQPRSIDEIGSTFTIQGSDLNYAGVIIGPSVGFEAGQLIFRPRESANRHATQHRSLQNGGTVDVAEDLLRNQLNVLLTRGVHGLFLYATDPPLRDALLRAQGRRS